MSTWQLIAKGRWTEAYSAEYADEMGENMDLLVLGESIGYASIQPC